MYRHGMSKTRHAPEDECFWLIRSLAGGMANGGRFAPHQHDWHQLILVEAGVLTVSTDRGTWVVPPRWAVWAEACTDHALEFHGCCRYATLYLRRRRSLVAASRVIAVSELLAALIHRTLEIGMLDRRNAAHKAMATLIQQELPERSHPALAIALPSSPRLQHLAELLLESPGRADDLDTLAARAGVSGRTLERQFRAETGLSFGAWRRHARFQRALRLIAEGRTIRSVAAAAGYSSASAFISAFAAVFQTTPGRFFAADAERKGQLPRATTHR